MVTLFPSLLSGPDIRLLPERCSKPLVILSDETKEKQSTMEKADSLANDQRNEEKVTEIQCL